MRQCLSVFTLVLALSSTCGALADGSDTKDAVIGGGIGGALGAAVGSELGDREGAIVGAAVGAAIGVAISTEGGENHKNEKIEFETDSITVIHTESRKHSKGRHCPPGQAKKGRC